MKRLNRNIFIVTAVVLVTPLVVNLYVMLQSLQAAGESREHLQLNAGIALADNLTTFKGKTVTVILKSGQSMTGIVKEVKNNLLHLEKISQKEFYDALITINHISAIKARVRYNVTAMVVTHKK